MDKISYFSKASYVGIYLSLIIYHKKLSLTILDFKYSSAIIWLRNKPLPYVAGRFFMRCVYE